jgi:katanin p60 ATPase-containing subunit A1
MDGVNSANSAGANEQEEEGTQKNVIVLAATNRPQDLDEAIRRRLEKRVYIPLPTSIGRKQLFQINLREVEIAPDVDFDHLVDITDGYSGADIANVCRDAAMMPLRKKIAEGNFNIMEIRELQKDINVPLAMKDFLEALKNVCRSVS